MATIIRSITNISSDSIDIFVPGYDAHHPIVSVGVSVTLDLLSVVSPDILVAIQTQLNDLIATNTITVAATINTSVFSTSSTLPAGGTIAGTLICYKDNATSLRVRGPQAPSEGGADVQSYSGIFYNDAYVNTGTLKTRVIHGANLEMDLELQSPHQVRVVAVDDTQADGQLFMSSKTNAVFNLRADAEIASPKQLIIDRVSTGSTGVANTSDINLKVDSGTLYLNAGVTTGAVGMPNLTTVEKDAIVSPVEGMVVYDVTLHKLCVYTAQAGGAGTGWETVTSVLE